MAALSARGTGGRSSLRGAGGLALASSLPSTSSAGVTGLKSTPRSLTGVTPRQGAEKLCAWASNAAAGSEVQQFGRQQAIGADVLSKPGGTAGPALKIGQVQRGSQASELEKVLGQLALRSSDSVDVAIRLVDLATQKVGKSRLKELYEARAVVLTGRLGTPKDFRSDNAIKDFARVWQHDVFAEAVQCICSANGFACGKWNVATSVDYPGQPAQTEARFSLHWGNAPAACT
mmetsp:Transcript_103107/g.189236  ORF Transcript_103107/g.189236 Transcript_103107/m.189236 type:complete len:232 (+) Transcript_103107:2-697(+)